jgi:hypothetical protein
LPLSDQLVVPLPSEIDIVLRGLPAPFLEGVQDVHRLCELRDIQDAMLQSGVDADLPNARPDSAHRLPVRWIHALLDTAKLKPGESPRVAREGANVDPVTIQTTARACRTPLNMQVLVSHV